MSTTSTLRFDFHEYRSLDMWDRSALDRIERDGTAEEHAAACAAYGISPRNGGAACVEMLFDRR